MALRVLIAPDKFKGTLTALQAARAIAAGWHAVRPRDRLTLLPMSDGGDGFGEMMGLSLGARAQTLRTVDAAHRPCRAKWWWAEQSRTAIIEAARINGLAMLPPGKYHPFELDTFGLGAALKAAAAKGAKHCLIGIGGSATNDAGFGLARALGWQFLCLQGKNALKRKFASCVPETMLPLVPLPAKGGGVNLYEEIQRWIELPALVCSGHSTKPLKFGQVTVAVDVQNPLLGPRGCTRVYGPQKGLKPEDFPDAERALRTLVRAIPNGQALARTPGAGAAGGLGFGLMAFAGARLEPGFDLFAKHVQLESKLKEADLVVTGEGAIDRSTLMGKGVGELARLVRKAGLPCIGLAGVVPDEALAAKRFTWVRGIVPGLAEPAVAKANPAPLLRQLARHEAQFLTRIRQGR